VGGLLMYKTNLELIEKCRTFREKGFTLGEIIKIVGLPKTTVYGHIRDILLSEEVKKRIQDEHTKRLNEFNKGRKGKCLPGRTFLKPKSWSLELIFIVSHFMFDGQIKYCGCEYYNRSDYLIKKMKETIKEILKIDSKIYKRDFDVKQLRYYYVELGQYIKRKSKELFDYIKTASLQEKKVFLKSFFDDEGCVNINKNIRRIRGYQHNLKTLELIQKLLDNFSIESKIDIKYKEIVISRKENLIKFRDEINFSKGIYINPNRKNSIWKKKLEKRKILDRIIKSYKN